MKKEIKALIKESNDTKEKLCILALDSYVNEGAHLTNFQSLANELEISQAAIYKHFKNKEDLLVHAIKYAADKGRIFIDLGESPNDKALSRLQSYLKRNLDFCIEQRIFSIAVITLHYFAACIPEVKTLHEEINERRIKKIETFLIHAQHEKSINSKLNTRESAEFIHSLLLGEMVKTFLWPETKTSSAKMKTLWPSIEKILN